MKIREKYQNLIEVHDFRDQYPISLHIKGIQKKTNYFLCIATRAEVTIDPRRAFPAAVATICGVPQHVRANAAAAPLREAALVAAGAAVVVVAEHVAAVLLAAVEEARAVVRPHPVACRDAVVVARCRGATASAFFYCSRGQEPAGS